MDVQDSVADDKGIDYENKEGFAEAGFSSPFNLHTYPSFPYP
jgi:hypothetical protein